MYCYRNRPDEKDRRRPTMIVNPWRSAAPGGRRSCFCRSTGDWRRSAYPGWSCCRRNTRTNWCLRPSPKTSRWKCTSWVWRSRRRWRHRRRQSVGGRRPPTLAPFYRTRATTGPRRFRCWPKNAVWASASAWRAAGRWRRGRLLADLLLPESRRSSDPFCSPRCYSNRLRALSIRLTIIL